MFEEEKGRILGEIAELTRENNRLLKKLVRAQNWATAWSVLWWLIVIASTLGVYYYFQPYLDQLFKTYQQLGPQLTNLNNLLPKP